MKGKEITNVIPVENPSLNQDILRHISRHFMKDKVITNVILMKNSSLIHNILMDNSLLLLTLLTNPKPWVIWVSKPDLLKFWVLSNLSSSLLLHM